MIQSGSSESDGHNRYVEAWAKMMVDIWEDKITKLHVVDTGRLYSSLSQHVADRGNGQELITHQFLKYGQYVDSGVGNGYKAGNGGNLDILDPMYRAKHNMGAQRERRPWFSRSYSISMRVLQEKLPRIYEEEILDSVISVLEKKAD